MCAKRWWLCMIRSLRSGIVFIAIAILTPSVAEAQDVPCRLGRCPDPAFERSDDSVPTVDLSPRCKLEPSDAPCVLRPTPPQVALPPGFTPAPEYGPRVNERRSPGAMIAGIVLSILGAGSLATGGGVLGIADSACQPYRGSLGEACHLAHRFGGIGLLIGGGAAEIVGIPLAVWGSSSSPSRGVSRSFGSPSTLTLSVQDKGGVFSVTF